MKTLVAEDLHNLEIGQKVTVIRNYISRTLTFAGKNPTSPNRLIFCCGDYIEQPYIRNGDKLPDIWLSGEYNSKEIGEIIINNLQENIKLTKEVYFRNIKQ